MKKVLALTLSAVLAMGAATTAFAANDGGTVTYKPDNMRLGIDQDTEEEFWLEGGKKMAWDTFYSFPITGVSGIYVEYDEDGEKIESATDNAGQSLTAEELFDLVDSNKATLKVDVTKGREYLESIKIVDDNDEFTLDITTADSQSTKDGKVSFEIELKDRGSNSEFATRTITVRDLKIGYGVAEGKGDASSYMNVDEDGVVLDTDDMEACEDYEITWGDDEMAMFVVDIDKNDGKKNLDYTTAPVDALIEANPEANMDFFTLKAAPRFNKIGEMTIYCDGDIFKYIYEIDTDGQIKELNATYDEDEEGFVFKTRSLGSYVISDIELVGAAVDEEVPGESDTTEVPGESDTTTDDGRENPATGANDMVNVAAAMAVVSLAAAGAVAFKKSSK